MVKWWEEMGPPAYVAAAAYMGMIKKKPKSEKSVPRETGNLNELAKLFGADGMLNG